MRIFRMFPIREPSLIYIGATESTCKTRKILSNTVHSYQRVPKSAEKHVPMHDIAKKYPIVADWCIEELPGTTVERVMQQLRKTPGVVLLNNAPRKDTLTGSPSYIYRFYVRECPELFTLRIIPAGSRLDDLVGDMFHRFQQLNAMRATRGQIYGEFPEAVIKAISRWYDAKEWAANLEETCPSLAHAKSRVIQLRADLFSPLDQPLGQDTYRGDMETRPKSLLRWLRDIGVPSLQDLHNRDLRIGLAPPPVPIPGFVTVLVARESGREKIVSVASPDASDGDHVLQMARASTPKYDDDGRWAREFYVAPPVYCPDVYAAKLLATSTSHLAANWDQFRALVAK